MRRGFRRRGRGGFRGRSRRRGGMMRRGIRIGYRM